MKKVISFSLWGDNPKYTIGAISNAKLAKVHYPGWEARFYCGMSVPQMIIDSLSNEGATIVKMQEQGDWRGMFWRFLPASEPDVLAMISRDTDSRLSARETEAVNVWLSTNKSFHIMRDHPAHGVPMLGGMWGVRGGIVKNISGTIEKYAGGDFWQVDQNFLKQEIYPLAIGDACVHDDFFEHQNFPTARIDNEFVGDVFDENEVRHPEHWKAIASHRRPSILMIQERGRHEKNRQFRESENFRRSFTRLGVKCDVWGLGHDNFSVPFDEIQKDYDVIFVMENYDEIGWLPNLANSNKLKVFWTIDCHCGAVQRHQEFCKKSKINVLLNSSAQYNKYFDGIVDKAFWFPNGYPSDLISPRSDVVRECSVGFCGSSIPNRDAILDAVGKYVDLKRDTFVIGEDMVKMLSSYKIAFNFNIADDINYRTFEAPAAGAMLLTNYTPNLEKLFDLDSELVVYRNMDDIIQKIAYFTKNEDERQKIADAGKKRVNDNHSYDERAKLFLRMIV
jgi:hypothetical protein